jgi:N-acyl-D-aspartate/D-glutamate deacylase
MAAAREDGLDVLAETTPLRDGIGQMAGRPADVDVLDYDALENVASLDNPTTYARGVEHVLVNGVVVVDAGRHTGAPGKHLPRS